MTNFNTLIILFGFCFVQHSLAINYSELSQQTLSLRKEIELQAKDNEIEQKSSTAEYDVLVQRKTELLAQIQKEKLRQLQLKEKLKIFSKKSGADKSEQIGKEFLDNWASDLTSWVQSSLPFRKETRLKKISEIKSQIGKNMQNDFGQLWDFTEKEIKLSQSLGFEILKISLQGTDQTAEVARIGMLKMYFRTTSKELGQVHKNNDNWDFVMIQNPDEKNEVNRIIDKFKNNERQNLFNISLVEGSGAI